MEYFGIIKNELFNCMPYLKEEYAKEGNYYNNFWKLMEIVKNPEIAEYRDFTKNELLLLRHRTGIINNQVKSYDEIANILNMSIDDVIRLRHNIFIKIELIMRNGLVQNRKEIEHSEAFNELYRIELELRRQFLEAYANSKGKGR